MKSVELVTVDTIRVLLENTYNISKNGWKMINSKGEFPLTVIRVQNREIELRLMHPFIFGEDSYVMYEEMTCSITITEVVRTKEFDQLFYYNGNDLGARYQREQTSLALWAPTATRVNLILYKHWSEEEGESYPCDRGEKGVWRINLQGDFENIYYHFEVYVNHTWRKVVDPYARFLSVNGEKAMIGDNKKTEPKEWPTLKQRSSVNDCIVYELHIRDFTIDHTNGIVEKGKYKALTEQNTKDLNQFKTGVDYLQQLGITHVEILPVQDFGSIDESDRKKNYNWGYDTTHFFVPEGSYALDPYDPYSRNRELKQAIASLHEKQLRVIMDVVFNHVYIWEESSLDLIVPGYFFRYTEENEISDGTGVGNDFASERKMARKIILDAICYWLDEYQVDGFRFDLMGILDLETMKQIEEMVRKRKQDIMLFGEGWDLPTAYNSEKRAIMKQAKSLKKIGFFQDRFRDALKGSTFEVKQPGYISGNDAYLSEVVNGIKGSQDLFRKPLQAINYIEAHDNHTLWDKLKVIHPIERSSLLQKRHQLGTAIVLLSQGIPFIHAGQEFFRTKHGVENSYNSPDWINVFDWKQRAYFNDSVQYIQTLIQLRRQHFAFRMNSYPLINSHFQLLKAESHCIAYHLKDLDAIDDWKDIVVIHNAGQEKQVVPLPKSKEFQVVIDDQVASLIPLDKIGGDCAHVSPFSTFVCVRT